MSEQIRSGARASQAAWGACLASSLILLGMLSWTRTGIEADAAAGVFLPGAAFALLHAVYTWLRPVPRISALTGGLAVLFWSGFASALTSVAALRSGAPLIDPALARADAALGLNTMAFVARVTEWPALEWLLYAAYVTTLLAVLVTVGLLAVCGQAARMWEAVFAFAASATFCAVSLAFLPAVAAFVHYGAPAAESPLYLTVIESYRAGAIDTIQAAHITGVATFPSFHATMAAIVAFGLRGIPGLSALGWTWAGIILVSTVVIGSHYAVDLPAGVALFVLCIWLVRMRPARSSRAAEAPA